MGWSDQRRKLIEFPDQTELFQLLPLTRGTSVAASKPRPDGHIALSPAST